MTSAAAFSLFGLERRRELRTLHWAEGDSPEPRALVARPVRHVRAKGNFLPHGHPRHYRTSPPALAAIVSEDDDVAEVTFATNPQAKGVT